MFEVAQYSARETRDERSGGVAPSSLQSRFEGNPADALSRIPTSVNLHLEHRCNYRCSFCYFTEIGHQVSVPPGTHATLALDDLLRLQQLLAEAGVERITYAGGEPTLVPYLEDLALQWHELHGSDRPRAMLVTNGTALLESRLIRMRRALAAVKLSAESTNDAIEARLGRGFGNHVAMVASRSDTLHRLGIRVDLNSVITRANCREDLTPLVRRVRPRYWKAFQMLPVPGQNDQSVADLYITEGEFTDFLARHSHLWDLLVPENNETMRESYAMIDPMGRFFQNTPVGYVRSSRSILEVGVEQALADVPLNWAKYDARGGDYRACVARRVA